MQFLGRSNRFENGGEIANAMAAMMCPQASFDAEKRRTEFG